MSITILNEFKALPGNFEALTEIFRRIVTQIRTVEGNERCEMLLRVADGDSDDERLIILETWTSIEAHQRAATAVDPKDFSAIMALLSEKPTGRYYQPIDS
ncbi:hypothetical protein MMA231_00744 [Asticcacaulis sp. MM231]|uniref:putative quinol monooxygenase n=1 Tax=Asticcacaulis sp. MM231 TaxID=3157666 RepID=UPI0032D5B044